MPYRVIKLIDTTKDKKLIFTDSDESDRNAMHVFSRKIKDKDLSKKEINRKVDTDKLTKIIDKLMSHGKEET